MSDQPSDYYEDTDSQLLAARLRHTITLLEHRIEATENLSNHQRALADHRLQQLEAQAQDYEKRLRLLQDSATQFKVLAGLATGGGLLSVISLIRSLVLP